MWRLLFLAYVCFESELDFTIQELWHNAAICQPRICILILKLQDLSTHSAPDQHLWINFPTCIFAAEKHLCCQLYTHIFFFSWRGSPCRKSHIKQLQVWKKENSNKFEKQTSLIISNSKGLSRLSSLVCLFSGLPCYSEACALVMMLPCGQLLLHMYPHAFLSTHPSAVALGGMGTMGDIWFAFLRVQHITVSRILPFCCCFSPFCLLSRPSCQFHSLPNTHVKKCLLFSLPMIATLFPFILQTLQIVPLKHHLDLTEPLQ